TFGSGPGLINGQGTAVEVLAIQGSDSGLGLLVHLHFHEAEPLGTARVVVHDYLGRLYVAVRLEQLPEIAIGHTLTQVADVQLLTHFPSSTRRGPLGCRRRRTAASLVCTKVTPWMPAASTVAVVALVHCTCQTSVRFSRLPIASVSRRVA